jgi:hypothetical protein
MLPRGRWRPIAPECLPSYPPRGPVGPAGPRSSRGSCSKRRNASRLSCLLTRLPRTPPRVTFRRGPACGCRLRGSVPQDAALCGSPVKVPASSRSPLFPVLHCRGGYRWSSIAHHLPGGRLVPTLAPFPTRSREIFPGFLPCLCLSSRSGCSRLSAQRSASPPALFAPASDRASGLLRPGEGRCLLGGRRGFTPWPKPRVHPDGPVRVAAPRRRLRDRVLPSSGRVYRS